MTNHDSDPTCNEPDVTRDESDPTKCEFEVTMTEFDLKWCIGRFCDGSDLANY
jgi:hypothetical protein